MENKDQKNYGQKVLTGQIKRAFKKNTSIKCESLRVILRGCYCGNSGGEFSSISLLGK